MGKRLLDERKQQEVCTILAVGATRQLAAQYVGCSVDTIRRTAKRDPAFAEALSKCSSRLEITFLQRIIAAASDERHWRAAAWALERIYPHRYGAHRAKSITMNDVAELIDRFAELVADQLPEVESRQKVLAAFESLTAELKTEQLAGLVSHPPTRSPRKRKGAA